MFDVSGSLRLTVDGQDVDVTADGNVVRAEIGRPRRLLRALGFGLAGAVVVRRLAKALDRYGMTIVVTQRGRPIARIGSGVRRGIVGTILRIPNLRFERS